MLSIADLKSKLRAEKKRDGTQREVDIARHLNLHDMHLHFVAAARERSAVGWKYASFGQVCRRLARDKAMIYTGIKTVLIHMLMRDVILTDDDADRVLAAKVSPSAYRGVIAFINESVDPNGSKRPKRSKEPRGSWIDRSVAELKEWMSAPDRTALRDALRDIWKRAKAIMVEKRCTYVTYRHLEDACKGRRASVDMAAAAAALTHPCDDTTGAVGSPLPATSMMCCDVSDVAVVDGRPSTPVDALLPSSSPHPSDRRCGDDDSATGVDAYDPAHEVMPSAVSPSVCAPSLPDPLRSHSSIGSDLCASWPRGDGGGGTTVGGDDAWARIDDDGCAQWDRQPCYSLGRRVLWEPRALVEDMSNFVCSDDDDDDNTDGDDDDDDDGGGGVNGQNGDGGGDDDGGGADSADGENGSGENACLDELVSGFMAEAALTRQASASSGPPVVPSLPSLERRKRPLSATFREVHGHDDSDSSKSSPTAEGMCEVVGDTTSTGARDRGHDGSVHSDSANGDDHCHAAKRMRISAAPLDPNHRLDNRPIYRADGNVSEREKDPLDDMDREAAALQAEFQRHIETFKRVVEDAYYNCPRGAFVGGVWRRESDGAITITDAARDLIDAATRCMEYVMNAARWSDRGKVYNADARDAIAAETAEARKLGPVSRSYMPVNVAQRRRWRLRRMMGDVMDALMALDDPMAIAGAMTHATRSVAQDLTAIMARRVPSDTLTQTSSHRRTNVASLPQAKALFARWFAECNPAVARDDPRRADRIWDTELPRWSAPRPGDDSHMWCRAYWLQQEEDAHAHARSVPCRSPSCRVCRGDAKGSSIIYATTKPCQAKAEAEAKATA